MSDIDISVVIPVKNGEGYLDSALRAVFSQKTDFRFEVVIVDSGSRDATLDIIKNYPACRLYQIKEKDFNHGLTRNFGISQAMGRYVILMTQDAVPCDRRWMGKLVDNIDRDGRVAGVYSSQIPHKNASILAKIRTNNFFTSRREKIISYVDDMERYDKLSAGERHRFCNFDNVSSCIRRAVWENFKFSNAEFGEDIEWAKRVLEAGYKIVYEPDSAVYHSHEYSAIDWYRRNRVNYKTLHSIFGLRGANAAYKVLPFLFICAIKDFYNLGKFYKGTKDISAVLSGIFLIPIYSFFGALGQYDGIRKANSL
jgi:rhamnosyltransferase